MRYRIVCLAFTLTFALATSSEISAMAQAPVPTSPPRVTRQPANQSSGQSTIGVEVAALTGANARLLRGAGVSWVRRNALLWAAVEPKEGARNWAAMATLDQELQTASRLGMRVILIIRDTPAWAQRDGTPCGPIRADKMAAFGAFVRDAAERYTARPYNVRFFELWNEPDVQTGLIAGDNPFGCWGDGSDPGFGGGYYAQALKVTYPQIKAANPQAQVLIGGLLLDCPWTAPVNGRTCQESRFLEGVLDAGGGAFFDAVSFHAYDYFGAQQGVYANGNWNSTYATTGPVLIAKARFIRDVLNHAGAKNKPLLNTESGLLCRARAGTPECETTKANYVVQAYTAALAEGLAANVWYSLEGWNGTNLIDGEGKPLPAYTALQVASANLGKATFVDNKKNYPGVWVYEFTNGVKRLWVAWSPDARPKELTLPRAPTRAFDALGRRIAPAVQMIVDANPIYLEWPR